MKVRDLIKRIEHDGWTLTRSRGSRGQFHHPSKPGTVTIAGHPAVDIPPGTLNNILKQGRSKMKYLVVYEKSATGWGAYAPDLLGLGVAAATLDEVKE
jgi:predicted RNA binding protein YcfA (HicA-like mRNA interferase family)